MSWENVAVCWHCWKERNPDRQPYQLKDNPPEVCFFCGVLTDSGIYIRAEVTVEPTSDKPYWTGERRTV